jgi:hypothetical protein
LYVERERRDADAAGFGSPYNWGMNPIDTRLRARVENGRLVMDVPTDLPEGTVLDLIVDDEGDDLDDAEREALHAALDESIRQVAAGKVRPASEILARLRRRDEP